MLEILQVTVLLNSLIIFNTVIFKGALLRGNIDSYFPRFYTKFCSFSNQINKVTYPVASVIIVFGGPIVLPRELYAIWILVILCISFLYLKAREQKVEMGEVQVVKNTFVNALLLFPVCAAHFIGSILLPLVVVFNRG